ncbi:MAG: H-NS histone family protein [Paracoccaceae bacterium]
MAVNIAKLSRKELEVLKVDIEKTLVQLEKTERKEAKKAAEDAAAKFGFTLSDLTGASGKVRINKAPVAPKYANPGDESQTWSGRGRQPQWFKDAVASGKTPEKMEI